ncbi:PAS domain-containing sensor histidine kinase [Desulfobacula sp.]|uniref:sensor histidine kinase n=1 Tax=Desulfobacula sp. TaxID=2593537 RepID=UPI00262EAD92|nr:PAS domain-containing sensor histidine kinase [Desulfobacula sp.]
MDQNREGKNKKDYSRLFRRFIFLTMVCSLFPLLLAGWAINIHYSEFARERILKTLQTRVEYHKKIIELFLKENKTRLDFIARTNSIEFLIKEGNLTHILNNINRDDWVLTDIGIIDENGDHAAYVGPYKLIDKNYSNAFWFKEVMEKEIYTSDMFMGFRKEPHFIMAVTKKENGRRWILRATVNTDSFRSLVENVRIGRTGDVYILNSKGIYQTSPGFSGEILTQASGFKGEIHDDLKFRFLEIVDRDVKIKKIVCETWLKDPRWLLVVRVGEKEFFEDIRHANRATLVSLHLSALIILIVTVFVTNHMVQVIKKRDSELEEMNTQLMQAGKLASIGELSAGVAHEINNPLAIIMTEHQLLLDAEKRTPITDPEFGEQFAGSLSQIGTQVRRCAHITKNLMKFARRTKSVIETININVFVREVIDLMEREAKSDGITFKSVLDDTIPPILTDPSQLQQVLLNIINNAIAAHENKGYGMITIATRLSNDKTGIVIIVEDTGNGIKDEDIEKVFDPFFTTKSPGQGTGLGLSICYSIVKQLGGNIHVESDVGKGTLFTLTFPLKPPENLLKHG